LQYNFFEKTFTFIYISYLSVDEKKNHPYAGSIPAKAKNIYDLMENISS